MPDGRINQKEAILERLAAHHPRYENHFDLFERAKVIKNFFREYIRFNPLDNATQEKYGIISHSRTMATLTSSGVTPEGDLIDYTWLKNC